MSLTTLSPTLPTQRHCSLSKLLTLKESLAAQTQPPNSYLLGLAADGLPVIANITRSPAMLATSDHAVSLQALLGTIAATAKFPGRQTSIGAVIVSRTPERWHGINPMIAAVSPKRMGDILQYHIRKPSTPRLPILLDNLGAGWNIEYRSLSLLANAPQFHLVVSASPDYACRIRSIFTKILIGEIHDFPTLFDLTAPTTLSTPLTNGQFAFRHQSRWLTFTPATQ
ncbi:MAG: hypothetical protein RBS68_14315 [Anaerolineales bacterium]|nr:hypothetical protein [Anaerolineales bacterium]